MARGRWRGTDPATRAASPAVLRLTCFYGNDPETRWRPLTRSRPAFSPTSWPGPSFGGAGGSVTRGSAQTSTDCYKDVTGTRITPRPNDCKSMIPLYSGGLRRGFVRWSGGSVVGRGRRRRGGRRCQTPSPLERFGSARSGPYRVLATTRPMTRACGTSRSASPLRDTVRTPPRSDRTMASRASPSGPRKATMSPARNAADSL